MHPLLNRLISQLLGYVLQTNVKMRPALGCLGTVVIIESLDHSVSQGAVVIIKVS